MIFPFRKPEPQASPDAIASPPLALIVEDEMILRLNAVEMLEDMGFSVINSETADEALTIMEKQRVELLISDIHMPGKLDGLALARLAAERWPDMRTVICSGRVRVVGSELPTNAAFVGKPYTVEDLENAILSF